MCWRSLLLLLMFITVSISGDNGENSTESSTTETTQEQEMLSVAINEFGFKLLAEEMKNKPDTNIVMSPAGVAGLLAMTLLGSAGKTHEQLAAALGFSQDVLENRAHHEEFGELLQFLNDSSTSYADAIFVEPRVRVRPLYLDYLRRVYRGDARVAPFNDAPLARDTINGWIKNNTNGKIEEFLKQALPVETKIVLLSALYFSGQWQQPFTKEHTKKMLFKSPSGDVLADLMLNYGQFQYTYSVQEGLQMLALPYNDSRTTLYVLKPLKRLPLSDIMQRLNYSQIDQLISKMATNRAIIRFPKMDIKNSIHLEDSLKTLGLGAMFSPEANFALMIDANKEVNATQEELLSRISFETRAQNIKDAVDSLPNPGVHVDTVLHEVRITIDEYGTEAVAATGGFLTRTAEQFYVDRPFYMFIRDERTKLVTFSAVIFDPTAV